MTIDQVTISDRNSLAYFIALGHQCEFIRNNGRIEGVFQLTPEFQESQTQFMQNAAIPVQSFIAASRLLSDMIRRNKEAAYEQRG